MIRRASEICPTFISFVRRLRKGAHKSLKDFRYSFGGGDIILDRFLYRQPG
jgi:hypothetical protein